MKTVYWSPEARSQLREIQQYISYQHAEVAAGEMVKRLLSRTRQLAVAPLSGHKIPNDYQFELRELLENPYRIIYRVKSDQVEILTVKHYRQSLSKMLETLPEIDINP